MRKNIAIRVPLLLIAFGFLFGCNNTEKISSNKNIIIMHSHADIKNEQCRQMFDSSTAYAGIGDYVTAQKYLLKCKELEPNNATILSTLGVSYFTLGDSTTALRYYFAAIDADSSKLEGYSNAGCLLQMEKKYIESISILSIGYNKGNKNNFTHYSICLNLAITYYKIDSCKQAKKYLAIAKENGFNNHDFDSGVNSIEQKIYERCK